MRWYSWMSTQLALIHIPQMVQRRRRYRIIYLSTKRIHIHSRTLPKCSVMLECPAFEYKIIGWDKWKWTETGFCLKMKGKPFCHLFYTQFITSTKYHSRWTYLRPHIKWHFRASNLCNEHENSQSRNSLHHSFVKWLCSGGCFTKFQFTNVFIGFHDSLLLEHSVVSNYSRTKGAVATGLRIYRENTWCERRTWVLNFLFMKTEEEQRKES